MPDDRRRTRRARLSGVHVTVEDATGERREAEVLDLSPEGLFVRTDARIAVGKRLSLEIHVAGEPSPWPALGRVVWIRTSAEGLDRPAGLGMTLIDIDDVVSQAIARLVETREPTDRGLGLSARPGATLFGVGAVSVSEAPPAPLVAVVERTPVIESVVVAPDPVPRMPDPSIAIDLIAKRSEPFPVTRGTAPDALDDVRRQERTPPDPSRDAITEDSVVVPKRRTGVLVVGLLFVAAAAAAAYVFRNHLPEAWARCTAFVNRVLRH
jgi:Tfp pilus assembly protein PilZ